MSASEQGAVPPEIAADISVLNAHARAYGCGRDAIYAIKVAVTEHCVRAGQAQARPVGVMAKCNFCLGTGRFFSEYEGQTNEACRRCNAKGQVYLRFAETTIHGQRWHHPWEGHGGTLLHYALGFPQQDVRIAYDAGSRSLIVRRPDTPPEEIPFGAVGDWQPNTPGARLLGERAAEILNRVENWLFDLPSSLTARHHFDRAQRLALAYELDLGCIGAACHLCGSDATGTAFGHHVWPFHWSRPVCRDCQRPPPQDWDKTIPPNALTPEIVKWRDRRPHQRERAWA